MKDELIDLLRDRFSGHELEVPHTVWENVSGQLAASASGESLREALHDKFQAHEVDVDPSAWSNISTQLGHGAAAGTSFGTAWIAAGITAVVITAGVILWNSQETPTPIVAAPIENVTEQRVAAMPTAPETMIVPEAAATKQEPEPLKQAAPKQTATVAAKQQDEHTSTKSDAPGTDASRVVTKSTPSVAPNGPMETRSSVPSPPAPVPQEDPSTEGVKTPATGPSLSTTAKETAPPTSDATPSALPEMLDEDPFAPTDPFDIFIPNVMTPNGDKVNDVLVITAGEHLKALVRIFAKNGSLIFQSTELSQHWDGLLPNGNIAEEGYYTCVVEIIDLVGKPHIKPEVIRLYR